MSGPGHSRRRAGANDIAASPTYGGLRRQIYRLPLPAGRDRRLSATPSRTSCRPPAAIVEEKSQHLRRRGQGCTTNSARYAECGAISMVALACGIRTCTRDGCRPAVPVTGFLVPVSTRLTATQHGPRCRWLSAGRTASVGFWLVGASRLEVALACDGLEGRLQNTLPRAQERRNCIRDSRDSGLGRLTHAWRVPRGRADSTKRRLHDVTYRTA